MRQYRTDINIDKEERFGIEIEFAKAELHQLAEKLKDTRLPIEYQKYHKRKDINYDRWYLDLDSTVTEEIEENLFGGEVSSRILRNLDADWLELEKVCQFLIENKAQINKKCALQVSIDIKSLLTNSKFWEIFLKIIATKEDELKLFYKGENNYCRKTSYKYARSLKYHLLEYINEVDFQNEDFFYEMRSDKKTGILLFTAFDGINLQYVEKTGRMEIKYPNGTLNPKVIQNDINFSFKLIESILMGKWDLERLNYQIAKEKMTWNFDEITTGEIESLVETITRTEEDRLDFLEQYEKVMIKK